jgi:hypothetical protein
MGPFLEAAITEMLDGTDREGCQACRFSWSSSPEDCRVEVGTAAERFAALLAGASPGTASRGGWSPSGYVWHVADVARAWAERLHALRHDPTVRWAGFDPDELGRARRYDELPAVSAPWAVSLAVAGLEESLVHLDPDDRFDHPEWGGGTVADALRWIAHEVVHHQLDVQRGTTGPTDR